MVPSKHEAAVDWGRATLSVPGLRAEIAWNGEVATTYRLREGGSVLAYLKVGDRGQLAGERDRLLWLGDKLPVPDVLGFASEQDEDWLLTAPLPGVALNQPDFTRHPHRVVSLLVSAMKRLHDLNPAGCPFVAAGDGQTVIHGDSTLPNFVFDGTEFAGYLDLGLLGVGSPEVDLAAALWSLNYNLGPGFGVAFLREYGWPETDEATVERLQTSPWKPE